MLSNCKRAMKHLIISKKDLQDIYSREKSIRKTAELLGSNYYEIRCLLRFFNIKRNKTGNPFNVPHRRYGSLQYDNGILKTDLSGNYITRNGEILKPQIKTK